LRALAWLEQAIDHDWAEVRPADLVAFAYASLGSWWPRPSVGISHRSSDVKPTLTQLGLWGSPDIAIDATTVPAHENNTGFVWRLFAATPAILRVRSPSYQDTVWCRREAELTQYLIDGYDFLAGRAVVDTELDRLPAISEAITRDTTQAPSQPRPTFPPRTLVLDVPSYPPSIVHLFAAMSTLRLLNGLIDDVAGVNRIAQDLSTGSPIHLPPPTNHPGGWQVHYEVFQALAEHAHGEHAPVQLADEYPVAQRQGDIDAVVLALPDLQCTASSAIDLLAALEWRREIRHWFTDKWGSDRVVVDCRGISRDDWTSNPRHAVKRGMVELVLPTLTFIRQTAGQDADSWPVIDTDLSPILTEYLAGQFGWLIQALTYPTWIAAYTSLPEFEFDPGVVEAAFVALRPEFAAYSGLSVPQEYSDVFAMDPTGFETFLTPEARERFADEGHD
jgi:hypothetical protein